MPLACVGTQANAPPPPRPSLAAIQEELSKLDLAGVKIRILSADSQPLHLGSGAVLQTVHGHFEWDSGRQREFITTFVLRGERTPREHGAATSASHPRAGTTT